MNPRHLNCLAHFGDPPDGSIDVRESVYMYIYKENIVREHLTGPQHYPDNGLVSGTTGEVSPNQEEEDVTVYDFSFYISHKKSTKLPYWILSSETAISDIKTLLVSARFERSTCPQKRTDLQRFSSLDSGLINSTGGNENNGRTRSSNYFIAFDTGEGIKKMSSVNYRRVQVITQSSHFLDDPIHANYLMQRELVNCTTR
ncbi:hypothetical protein AVEN_115522-1 [Araneus ventricosus]|uniref:Uncharacterized protein n=1 Tax=Araneus ventricosus TaxID=182803 RepID=A0A4Y2CK70_ARAVE|nr:hypothetical protein AVEN_115522-1 [Araneus ventricosus]